MLTTDHIAPNQSVLDHALFSGLAWTAVGRWVAQAISWIATLYVARILTPADYGIVAMATIPIGLARLIEGLGLDAILLQDRSLKEHHLRQLAGAAFCAGAGLMGLYLALSVPISLYFHEPQVAAIVSLLSLTFVFDALQILPRALLQRDLLFRDLAWINAVQVTAAAGTMTMAAVAGLGYWALVFNTLTGYGIVTIILYWYRPVPPSLPRNLRELTRSLVSGWHLLVSRVAYYGYSSADSAFIGRHLGKDDLGVFGFATTFAGLPVREITSLVSGVVPGIFTAVQADKAQLRWYFFFLTEVISYLTLPAALGLAITADDFVLFALGDSWTGVITPLRLLCIYMAMYSAQELFSHVLLWTGHFSINMWLNVFALAVLPASFFIGVQFGLIGVSIAWLIGFPLSLAPAFLYINRILGISGADYWRVFRPAMTGCAIMLGTVMLVRYALPSEWHHAVRLAIQSVIGAACYTGAMLLLFGDRVYGHYCIIRQAGSSENKPSAVIESQPVGEGASS